MYRFVCLHYGCERFSQTSASTDLFTSGPTHFGQHLVSYVVGRDTVGALSNQSTFVVPGSSGGPTRSFDIRPLMAWCSNIPRSCGGQVPLHLVCICSADTGMHGPVKNIVTIFACAATFAF